MTLYVILARKQVDLPIDLSLMRACAARNIDYKHLVTEDIVLDDLRDLPVEPGDLLYRASLQPKARAAESLLIGSGKSVLTSIFNTQPLYPYQLLREISMQIASGLQIIPTQIVDETWLAMSDEELTRRVNKIGGLPVVVKSMGKSHGRGITRESTVAELRQRLQDYDEGGLGMVVRKYLDDYRHYRVIMIEDRVVAAIEYHKPDDDFRTNASENVVVTPVNVEDLPEGVADVALAGFALRSSLTGGADILVDQTTGKPYFAEVNVPCYFPRAEGVTGIDIGGQLVDALVRKAKATHG